eukprot:m.91459 g.91459  ORF g.91459 m.91459 type:complete len:57 (-) comp14634_c0_seq3:370-540(-)
MYLWLHVCIITSVVRAPFNLSHIQLSGTDIDTIHPMFLLVCLTFVLVVLVPSQLPG